MDNPKLIDRPSIKKRYDITLDYSSLRSIDLVYYKDYRDGLGSDIEPIASILVSTADLEAFYLIYLFVDSGEIAKSFKIDSETMGCINC